MSKNSLVQQALKENSNITVVGVHEYEDSHLDEFVVTPKINICEMKQLQEFMEKLLPQFIPAERFDFRDHGRSLEVGSLSFFEDIDGICGKYKKETLVVLYPNLDTATTALSQHTFDGKYIIDKNLLVTQ